MGSLIPRLDYELHKLGWQAFQDLCGTVLRETLGQMLHMFADSNDAGRDGAFHGHWRTPNDGPLEDIDPPNQLATVVQCKFSSRASGTLTPSMLTEELAKLRRLHERGLCDSYLVMTNLRVTGRTEEWLAREAAREGVRHAAILDGSWICSQIARSPELRRYVPRVYGLGDLAKVFDERRLRQAEALLARLRQDLRTFVPTGAYREAATALAKHGFVLLLGEPACGKSTIAATLAMSALDTWHCGVRRVDSPKELLAAWDPDEPDQLFWVDDAFGSIRHDAVLSDAWSRRMDQVMAAIERGAKAILTSRDYIYREARAYLKEYAYPRLHENQVVVDVARLTVLERSQILYNHLKAGDQPRDRLENGVRTCDTLHSLTASNPKWREGWRTAHSPQVLLSISGRRSWTSSPDRYRYYVKCSGR